MKSTGNRNHEGYHGLTAAPAIKRAGRAKGTMKCRRLSYRIGEVVDLSKILVKNTSITNIK